ncbi:MAG: chloride channel protein [Marinilabiliales bacterium]|nr:MAG: chloride channel protein [Marinilabiliales bacterium]
MQRTDPIGKFLKWRINKVPDKTFIIILSIIVGLASGIAAFVIKKAVYFAQLILTSSFSESYENYLYFAYPLIGILIAVLFIKFIVRQRVGHGIPSVLYAISKNNGMIKRHNTFSSIVTSAFTVGFGGSVGLEGPTVATGAAIGSNLGKFLHLNYKQVILMLGCACAGAMAAIFKAPIAAVVFALEVIMLDLTMASIVPLLISSATAALTAYFLMGQNYLYTVEIKETFHLNEIHLFIALGIITGLVSVYFTRVYMFIGGIFEKFKTWYKKLLIGGLVLGILLFLFPSLYGEGYETINEALRGDFSYLVNNSIFYDYKESFLVILALFVVIILMKVIATSVTFGAGGIGGIFAPSLFLGANTGLFFSTILKHTGVNINGSTYALVGMAGTIAGIIHAPLTAIFLIAEITGGYHLFMPLMLTSTISYATMRLFESNSVYTIQLASRGELMTHDKDKAVLSLMKVNNLIETNFKTIQPDYSLRELVDVISKSTRNIFPVVDESDEYIGIVLLDHIRHIMFKHEMYDDIFVRDLFYVPSYTVHPDDSMEDVAKKFQDSGNFNIVVVQDGKYLGFVSRANVFSSYRRMLKQFSED